MSPWAFWLCAILFVGSCASEEVPFIFGEALADVTSYTPAQFEQASTVSPELMGVPIVTQASDDDIIAFPITGGSNTPAGTAEKKVRDLKRIFDDRVDTNNSYVLNKGAILAAKFPGDLTIDQVSAIYEYIKNGDGVKRGWSYVRDRRGLDYYRYANESLKMGDDAYCSGVGDCDDFAILMSALIESIGGTTRVILAQNNSTGGHAYAEVYLGNLGDQSNMVNKIIDWLKLKYNTDKIYTHIDTDTRDVWLNLDWGPENHSGILLYHPGGPFFQGSKHILLSIRDKYKKTSLLMPQTSNEDKSPVEASKVRKLQEDMITTQKKDYDNEKSSNQLPVQTAGGADALIDKGISQYNEGDYEEAIISFDQVLNQDPNNYLAWELKGLASRASGKYDDALNSFDKAISLDSSREDAWKDKGETLYMSGQFRDAVNCFDKAIQIRPCSDYWKMKGEALMGAGSDKEASDAFVMAQKSANCKD